ncbi:hypothetical protein [Lyngbya sp. CCY1209]|uniref:hypothetical protein n=1 Tax=Lyngbya sp. CCY1209 TaxID=2886103 RepID=UPI002D20FEB0|nr:hypothetical protein [Lyngbya sp. CCY1209]MEB3885345.1 hypothetical protein [Lyngbya sp. CCY1209]
MTVASGGDGSEQSAIPGIFSLFLSDRAPAGGVEVAYSLDGEAQPVADYRPLSGTVLIPEGEFGANVFVNPVNDAITVSAVDDGIVEDVHSSFITHAAASADADYEGIEIRDFTANIRDRSFDPRTTAEGLGVAFDRLQEVLERELHAIALPIVGEIDDFAPAFIERFRNTVVNRIVTARDLTQGELELSGVGSFNTAFFDAVVAIDEVIQLAAQLQEGENIVIERGSYVLEGFDGFGYDTSGLTQWANNDFAASEAFRVLDGFFLSDRGPDRVRFRGSSRSEPIAGSFGGSRGGFGRNGRDCRHHHRRGQPANRCHRRGGSVPGGTGHGNHPGAICRPR